MDWTALGRAARASVDDADLRLTDDPNDTRPLDPREAYSFLLDNPECFSDLAYVDELGNAEWPAGMLQELNSEFIAGYFRVGETAA